MVLAEEYGITSINIDEFLISENSEILALLGVNYGYGDMMNLENNWSYNIIKIIGNYEEVFRNFAIRISLVLGKKLKEDVTPAESARIMDELKSVRWDTGGYRRDHAVDGGNYKFMAGALEEKK